MSSPQLTRDPDQPSTSAVAPPRQQYPVDDGEDGEIYIFVDLGEPKKPCYIYDSLRPFLFEGRRMACRPINPNVSYAFDAADALYDDDIVRRLSGGNGAGTSSSGIRSRVESCPLPPHPAKGLSRILPSKKRSTSNPHGISAAVSTINGSTGNTNSSASTTDTTSSRGARIRRRVSRILQACLAPFKSGSEVAVPFRLLRNRESHTDSVSSP